MRTGGRTVARLDRGDPRPDRVAAADDVPAPTTESRPDGASPPARPGSFHDCQLVPSALEELNDLGEERNFRRRSKGKKSTAWPESRARRRSSSLTASLVAKAGWPRAPLAPQPHPVFEVAPNELHPLHDRAHDEAGWSPRTRAAWCAAAEELEAVEGDEGEDQSDHEGGHFPESAQRQTARARTEVDPVGPAQHLTPDSGSGRVFFIEVGHQSRGGRRRASSRGCRRSGVVDDCILGVGDLVPGVEDGPGEVGVSPGSTGSWVEAAEHEEDVPPVEDVAGLEAAGAGEEQQAAVDHRVARGLGDFLSALDTAGVGLIEVSRASASQSGWAVQSSSMKAIHSPRAWEAP